MRKDVIICNGSSNLIYGWNQLDVKVYIDTDHHPGEERK